MKVRFLLLLAVLSVCANAARAGTGDPRDQAGHAARGIVGIQIASTQDGQTVIARVIDGGAAAAAGITAGDVITAVNGQSISGVDMADIAHQMAGAVGTNLTLSVRHTDGTRQDYTLTRRALTVPAGGADNSPPSQGAGQPGNPLDQTPPTSAAPSTQASEPGAPKPSAAGQTLILNRQTIHDDQAGVDAFTVFVPAGWTVDAKFYWDARRFDPVHPILRISNPNGPEAYANYGGRWEAMDYSRSTPLVRGTRPIRPPERSVDSGSFVRTMFRDPADLVQNTMSQVMGNELQTARLVERQDMPELAALQLPGYNGMRGANVRVTRLRYEYTFGGTPVQEDLYVSVGSVPLPGPGGMVSWYFSVVSFRAEKGKLDDNFGLLYAIGSSAKPTLQYSAVVQNVVQQLKDALNTEHQTEMMTLNAYAQRSAIRAQSAQAISQTQQDTYNNQIKAQDETAEKWSQLARGVETRYNPDDPDKTPVEVPSGYSNVWMNGLNQVVLSNDNSYVPTNDPSLGNVSGTFHKMSDPVNP